MLKDGPNHDIFDRLYRKSSQYEHLPSQVTDNIYFLNRHCKFLSYAEKENIIILLKKRDPQLESAISGFKANKISKQYLKDIFYAILYPKRVSKKHNENLNPLEAEPRNLRDKRSPEGFQYRKDGSLNKSDLALDPLSSNTSHYKYEDAEAKAAHKRREYMNSMELSRENLKSAKPHQRSNVHNKTRSVINVPNYYSNMSLIQEEPEYVPEKPQRKLSEIDQFLHKLQTKVDFYTKGSHTTSYAGKHEAQNLSMTSAIRVETFQDQSIESHNERSYRDNGLTRSMGYPVDNLESLNSDSFLRKKARAINEEEYKQHNRVTSSPPVRQDKPDSPNILGVTVVQNPDLMNPFMSSTMSKVNNPVTRKHEEEITVSGRGNNRIFILQHMGTEADSTAGEPARIRRIEDALEDMRNSGVTTNTRATEEFLYSEPAEQRQKSPEMIAAEDPVEKLSEFKTVASPTIQLESENATQQDTVVGSEHVVNTLSDSERYYKEAVEMGKRLLDNMKTGDATPQFSTFERNSGSFIPSFVPEIKPQKIEKIEKVERIEKKEVIPEIQVEQISTKPALVLMDTPVQSAEAEVKSENSSDPDSLMPSKKQFKELYIESSTSQPIPLNQDKLAFMPTLSANVSPKSISPILIDSKTDLGDSGSFGNKAERFVSVNLIKRIFEDNGIFAEDIVDEIFRYLGEYIVNKNYFIQIMTDYLNCLPQDCGIKPKDISTKIFEICDRNNDGLISVNDLGSRAGLFSQVRKGQTKERVLYDLLDTQKRGFIIENDIVNALTNVQTQACANGTNIFDDYEELLKECKKIVKDLDKEGKGIITYWDIFLWKDTESFAELSRKLQKYSNKPDTFTSAKKNSSSPRGNKNIFYTAQKMFDDFEHPSPTGFKPFSSVIQDIGSNNDFMESHGPLPKSQLFDNISLIPSSKEVSSDKSSTIKQTVSNFTARLFPENPELETSLDASMKRRSSITVSSKLSIEGMGSMPYYAAPVTMKYNQAKPKAKGFAEFLKEHTREDSNLNPASSVDFPSKNIESSEIRSANSFV